MERSRSDAALSGTSRKNDDDDVDGGYSSDGNSDNDDDDDDDNEDEEEAASMGALLRVPANRRLLGGAYLVLFLRYAIATFLSAFFPQLAAPTFGMSGAFEGLIFTAFPVGITVTSLIAPPHIARWGARRSVAAGMLLTALFTALMGFVPDLCGGDSASAGLLLAYLGSGLLGSLADTGAIIAVGNRFRTCSGTAMASVGTVSGLGCMAGPPLGGLLYGMGGAAGSAAAFRLPFLALSLLCALCGVATLALFPGPNDEKEAAEQAQGPTPAPEGASDTQEAADGAFKGLSFHARRRAALSVPVQLTLFAIALNGLVVATLDPTLAYRLAGAPFNFSASRVGAMFSISSVAYVATSVPVGWVVDRHESNPGVYKLVQSTGFFALFVTFALLGPVQCPGLQHTNTAVADALSNPVVVVAAMLLKGLGSSGNNAGFPDLVVGIDPDDEMLRATIAGWWNAVYAVGWALGPLLGGALYGRWGFATFATTVSLLCLGFAVLLAVAAVVWRSYAGPPALAAQKAPAVASRQINAPTGRDD